MNTPNNSLCDLCALSGEVPPKRFPKHGCQPTFHASMSTNLVSLVRDLQRRKGRRRRGLAVAEGVRLVEDALAAGVRLEGVVAANDLDVNPRGAALLDSLAAHDVPVEVVAPRTLEQLADIQPGLGTVMIEYATRFDNLWYAVQAGNWDMAKYQLKEMTEIQEVGENTRPGRAAMLKAFESANLEKLAAAIKAKDWKKFNADFKHAVVACNGCHAAHGFPFIKYQLPKSSPSPTSVRP